MASSSSANKVARVAARSSNGPRGNKQANWLFPAAIVALIVLGIGVVAMARNRNAGSNDNDTPPRAQLVQGQPADHWHAAFAVNVCGKELAPLQDGATDPLGIHTHGDGLIHIHPFSVKSGGKNATMKRYFDQVGLKVTDDGFKMPGSDEVYRAGETTCGGKATELVMAHWKDARTAASAAPDQVIRKDFDQIRFSEDLGAYTLALEVKGAKDFPAPSAAAEIVSLGAEDGGAAPPTESVPEVPIEPTDSLPADSTVPPDESTTAPPATDPSSSTPSSTEADSGQ